MLIRVALVCACIALAAQARDAQDGAALYQKNCAGCHDSGASRVPSRQALKRLSPERILLALESGTMMMMGARRTAPERHAIAEFLAAKPFGSDFLRIGSACLLESAGPLLIYPPFTVLWSSSLKTVPV